MWNQVEFNLCCIRFLARILARFFHPQLLTFRRFFMCFLQQENWEVVWGGALGETLVRNSEIEHLRPQVFSHRISSHGQVGGGGYTELESYTISGEGGASIGNHKFCHRNVLDSATSLRRCVEAGRNQFVLYCIFG